jgi:hypothetical protein
MVDEEGRVKRPMKLRYTAIYKLRGARLEDEAKVAALVALKKPALSALLTADPEPHFMHIDRSAALAAQLFKGLFAPDKPGTPEERLAAEIAAVKARRSEQASDGVYFAAQNGSKNLGGWVDLAAQAVGR